MADGDTLAVGEGLADGDVLGDVLGSEPGREVTTGSGSPDCPGCGQAVGEALGVVLGVALGLEFDAGSVTVAEGSTGMISGKVLLAESLGVALGVREADGLTAGEWLALGISSGSGSNGAVVVAEGCTGMISGTVLLAGELSGVALGVKEGSGLAVGDDIDVDGLGRAGVLGRVLGDTIELVELVVVCVGVSRSAVGTRTGLPSDPLGTELCDDSPGSVTITAGTVVTGSRLSAEATDARAG